ncbi:Sodium-translocating pyrophosphatase [Planctomycetales bacterium 10988]|nr:Sodium-translocating pyrophosphatase [Planctomycetales bacterium 10988]
MSDYEWLFVFFWLLTFGAAIGALFQAYTFFRWMLATDEGTPEMVRIAGYVREGANAYLYQQYLVVGGFFIVIFILLMISAFLLEVQSEWVPFAFITGGLFSGLSGWIGMKTATWASSRTAAGAQQSLNQGLQVAFRSGSVMGLVVVGLGLLDIAVWYAVLRWVAQVDLITITATMLCFGMGASSQALFARVGGGIFTKAADVGADLVGKVEEGIPEDDPRNPATIADNVGDNVGDVAGMGADLYESYCGSILATAALGVAAFHNPAVLETAGIEVTEQNILYYQLCALFLPMIIAAAGIGCSIGGVYLVRTGEEATQKSLLHALGLGINSATGAVSVAALLLTLILLPSFWTISFSIITGLLAGWAIGWWTEYSTSDEYRPTRELADQAVTGAATVIISGVADGMKSVWAPVMIVAAATLVAFGMANGWRFDDVNHFALGLYGVGIAAVGMLSTLGITLATDAYGPIADNAGGNAEMARLEPLVRQRTDALDSLGNTTAATGKGFAIGSAALTGLALLAAYVEVVREGFTRWADAEISIVSDDAGLYKLSPQFAVELTGEPGAEDREMHGWLLFPREAQDAEKWKEVSFQGDLNVVPKDTYKINEDGILLAGTKYPMVELQRATLPDFMIFYDASLMNPRVLVGVFLGAMATFVFCAMTMKAVGRAARGMVEEVRRQFRLNPEIMEGTVKPDYTQPVAISTKAAQREMILPSLLGLLTPILTGLILGVGGVMGLLVGSLTSGFCVAIFMANAGGAWDNAKKFIEAGAHGGKGTDAHKAAVVGDTVGDPFKDTSGPSLNILIKLMSMVSVVMAGLIVRYSLHSLGIF